MIANPRLTSLETLPVQSKKVLELVTSLIRSSQVKYIFPRLETRMWIPENIRFELEKDNYNMYD